MPDIYIAKRVIDYVGLQARGVPEGTLPLLRTLQPTLSLMQGMGPDGAQLLSVDAFGNLKIDIGSEAYSDELGITADRSDFSAIIDDAVLGNGLASPMVGSFTPAAITNVGGINYWQPVFNSPVNRQQEFKTRRVNGLPFLEKVAWLPLQANIQGGNWYRWGIESSDGGTPGAFFAFSLLAADFQVVYKIGDETGLTTVSIAGSLPGTYATATHVYIIAVNDDAVRWIIDGVVVFTLSLATIRSQVAGSYLGFVVVQGGAGPIAPSIRAFFIGVNQPGPYIRANFPSVSALNTQQQVVMDIKGCSNMLDIVSIASAGTATLQVEASTDNAAWTIVDTIAAALNQAKHYLNSTVGAVTAICPLAFRFLRITAGPAGAGNTTTLTVSAK